MSFVGAVKRGDARGERRDPERERRLPREATAGIRPPHRVRTVQRAPPHDRGDVVRG